MKKLTTLLLTITAICAAHIVDAQKPDISVTLFRDSALASTWCPYDSTLVAYNLLLPNGYYAIYIATIGPGNTLLNERCFTCGDTALPGKNVAQPIFHPSGKYMLFTAEHATHPGSSTNSIPGIGQYNDMYVVTMDGQKTYRLVHEPDTGLSGMIETYFSPDGSQVMWDEQTYPVGLAGKQEFGYWVVKTAPFIMDDTVRGPYIDSARIKVLQPGGVNAFNEPYGWSPDGSKIIFASDYNQFWVWDDQIYTMDTSGNNLKQMSSTAKNYPYCEHAFYSTDGKHIVWMTNEDCDTGSSVGGDDWWIMDSDASNQMRLTYFNDTTSAYWTGSVHINCHGSFSPDSRQFIGDVTGSKPVQTDPAASIGAAYIVTLNYLATSIGNTLTDAPLKCTLYPNPASDVMKISLGENTDLAHYSIFDITGSQVSDGKFQGPSSSIDVSNFSSGIYFLRIMTGSDRIKQRFIVVAK